MSRRLIKSMPSGSFLMLLLFIAILVSALAVSYSAHWNRQLLNELYGELSVRDKAQAEWGRLILEQSTWTAHNRIEALASDQHSCTRLERMPKVMSSSRVTTHSRESGDAKPCSQTKYRCLATRGVMMKRGSPAQAARISAPLRPKRHQFSRRPRSLFLSRSGLTWVRTYSKGRS